jgi:transposase-like protein
LEEQRSSGVSVRAFCRRHGLNESAFYQWRSRLAERDGQCESETSPLFVPVDVVPSKDSDRIEILLASGQRVFVPSGADAATLARVVGVLEGRSC